MAYFEPKDGQYYYAPRRTQWGVYLNRNGGNGCSSGTLVKYCSTKEEAKELVSSLNGWTK